MLELSAAVYRKTEPWAEFAAEGADGVARALGDLLAIQLERACVGIDPARIGMNFVVSTMLDLPFTSGWIDWESIRAHTRRAGVAPFDSFVSAYECASWGYCLRYAQRFLQPGQYVAISVLDLNVFDLSYWHANPNWGQSGFGLSTLVFRLSGQDRIECHIGKSINGFGEFCLDLRRCANEDPGLTVIPPYFPHNIAAMFTKLIDAERRLPNLTDEHGHCFGSDPWVGLIQRHAAGEIRAGDRYLASSVALNGYWCFAELQLARNGVFAFGPPVPAPLGVAA